MKRALLIDADTLVYQAAHRATGTYQWDEHTVTTVGNIDEGIYEIRQMVEKLRKGFEADQVVMALSNYSEPNWRFDVHDRYKEGRDPAWNKPRPPLWKPLREYIHEEPLAGGLWHTVEKPRMEGDDVLGILMTGSALDGYERVCLSIDKDMKTIPGLHANYKDCIMDEKFEAWEQSEEEADLFHLIQTLAGDSVDDYPGCPGVGMVRAERWLREGLVWETYEHTVTRGPRKGVVEQRSKQTEPGTPWEIVVSIFESRGQTAEDALINARLARILRAEDYDPETQEIKLWTP